MQKLCVFIGANKGISSKYLDVVSDLGKNIAAKKITLIYGGASSGLMGELADSVIAAGGNVIGIIPNFLKEKEIAHSNLTQLHWVDSMYARKRMMIEMADAFIAFPGGLGMLEETFEVWNSIKMGLYNKPLGVLNINNYFNSLLNFLNHGVKEEFIKKHHLDLITINDDPALLIDQLLTILLATTNKDY